MKALSGYAEWFWLLAKNIKPVENRSWSLTRYFKREQLPVRIYLHASKTKTPVEELFFIQARLTIEQLNELFKVDWSRCRGHIIGEITITDEVTREDISMPATRSPWFVGPFGFVVEDGVLYDEPIPYKGQLGFFRVEIGDKQ